MYSIVVELKMLLVPVLGCAHQIIIDIKCNDPGASHCFQRSLADSQWTQLDTRLGLNTVSKTRGGQFKDQSFLHNILIMIFNWKIHFITQKPIKGNTSNFQVRQGKILTFHWTISHHNRTSIDTYMFWHKAFYIN